MKQQDVFYKDSKSLKEYFKEGKMTKHEQKKIAILSILILDFYRKVYDKNMNEIYHHFFNNDLAVYGYLDNYGYYIIRYDSFGYYIIDRYEEDITSIFVDLIRNILSKKSYQNEYKNKKEIKKSYKCRFPNIKYSEELYHVEYALDKWYKYYEGIIPDKIIDIYQKHVDFITNGQNKKISLIYDKFANRFVYDEKEKTKKLTK